MPSCIDFHIKNCLKSFERTLTMETDPSDFYKLIHCVKSVCIQSYSGLHFPAFGLNMKRYGVILFALDVIQYRDHINLDSRSFFEKLKVRLTNHDINYLDFGNLKQMFYGTFKWSCFAKKQIFES